ncbi:MAG: hypothetical protein HYR76_10795 [Ignavibacteria bacterium]|nr:hypothetical protein [Ignavibacteria bacterium]MBI3765702.1 hypothetical protein [Ignavibacteriales bacterium]
MAVLGSAHRARVRLFRDTILFLTYLSTTSALSQQIADSSASLRKNALRAYIDCTHCDLDYIRSEVTFINYVRDRSEAQLHTLITTERAGNGGVAYTFTFIGQQEFLGVNDTLTYISKQSDTEEIIRAGLVQSLKLGLIRYVERTPLAHNLSIGYEIPSKTAEVQDTWDYWLFSINANGSFSGEQQQTSRFLSGSFSANRTTADLKINISGRVNNRENNFEIDDTTEIKNISRRLGFEGSVIFSLTDHWSTGASTEITSATFNNRKVLIDPAVGLEYNLFRYSESTRRQLRFGYEIHYNYVEYNEETIYFKNVERRVNEKISATLEVKEPWGTAAASLEASHYFHDFNKNRIELFGELSYRLIEGLSIRLFGSVSRIHDQLFLPIRGASTEEILLQQSQRATQYEYSTSIGFSYSFGSIYNNVVNARFGM